MSTAHLNRVLFVVFFFCGVVSAKVFLFGDTHFLSESERERITVTQYDTQPILDNTFTDLLSKEISRLDDMIEGDTE